jgi:hypothetical protein
LSEEGRREIDDVELITKPLCFVVAPIGAPDSDVRKKSDQVLKHLIKKALEPQYAVERADHIDRPGVITVQVVQRIFDADLVVADLTDRNPNVYYELAIRHTVGKPAIHIISRGEDIPFDVQDMRFVPYDLGDPDSLEEAQTKLCDHAKAIQRGEPTITPVQVAQILQSFDAGESRDAQLRALFESLNTGISNLQEGIAEVVQDLRKKNLAQMWSGRQPPNLMSVLTSLGSLANIPASGFSFPSRTSKAAEPTADHEKAKAGAIKKAEEAKDKK